MTEVVTTNHTGVRLDTMGNGDKHVRTSPSFHMESLWKVSQSVVNLGDTFFCEIRQAPLNGYLRKLWMRYTINNANVADTECQSLVDCCEPKLYLNGTSSDLLNFHNEDVKNLHLIYKTDTYQAGKTNDELAHYNYRKFGSYVGYDGSGFAPIIVPGSGSVVVDDDLCEHLTVFRNLPLSKIYDIKLEMRLVSNGDSKITHYINQNASDLSFDNFEVFGEYEVFVNPIKQPAMHHQWFRNIRVARAIPASEHSLDTPGTTYSIEMSNLFAKIKDVTRIFIWTQGNASATDKHTSYHTDFIDKVEIYYMGDQIHQRTFGDGTIGKRRLKNYAQEYHRLHNGGYTHNTVSGAAGLSASLASNIFLDWTSIFNKVPIEQYNENVTVTGTSHNDLHNLRIDIRSDSTGSPAGEALYVAIEYLSELTINSAGGINKKNVN